jgi:hypothetical protein
MFANGIITFAEKASRKRKDLTKKEIDELMHSPER